MSYKKVIELLIVVVVLGFGALSLNVSAHAATPHLNKSKVVMLVNEKYQYKVTGSKKKVVWKSSMKKVATINSKGVVQAKGKEGITTITATVDGYLFQSTLYVVNPHFKYKKVDAYVGETSSVGFEGIYDIYNVRWESSNPEVIRKKSKSTNRITGRKPGTTAITASYRGKKYKVNVVVKKRINYHSIDLGQGILVEYASITPLSTLDASIKFYNDKDQLVYIGESNRNGDIVANRTYYMSFRYPPKTVNYSYYKIDFKCDPFYEGQKLPSMPITKVQITHTTMEKSEYGYTMKNTYRNNSTSIIGAIESYVILYKENQPVAYRVIYGPNRLNITPDVEIQSPLDLNDIDFDSYKVFMNSATVLPPKFGSVY